MMRVQRFSVQRFKDSAFRVVFKNRAPGSGSPFTCFWPAARSEKLAAKNLEP
jgi:hypothetical protein